MIYKHIYIDTHKYTYNTYTHAHACPYMLECMHIYTHKYIHMQTEAARLGVAFMSHIYHIEGNKSPLY